MSPLTAVQQPDPDAVSREAKWIEIVVKVTACLLGVAFAVGKLRQTDLSLVDHTWSEFFLNAAAAFYYFTWISGSLSDLHVQRDVTQRLSRSRWELRATLLVFVICLGAFFVLLGRIHTVRAFLVVVLGILVWDVAAWLLYVRRTLEPQFCDSRRLALEKNDIVAALDVELVRGYMTGGWRVWRWGCGIGAAILIAIVDAAGSAYALPSTVAFAHVFSGESLVAFSVLLYLVGLEAWIWLFRIRRDACRAALLQGGARIPDGVRQMWSNHLR